jgi:hypothetical protein
MRETVKTMAARFVNRVKHCSLFSTRVERNVMFGDQQSEEPKPSEVTFHPMKADEYGFPKVFGGMQIPAGVTVRPKHTDYECGACGKSTNGRVLCEMVRQSDRAIISWCLCSCEREEPTLLVKNGANLVSQTPIAREFHASPNWPNDLRELYEEAAKSYSASAFTASAMLCRKMLMECACHEGDQEGKNFTQYVDFIVQHVLTMPKARATIEAIRSIGNEANHKVQFVAEPDARKAMEIATYLLQAVYSIPTP